MKKAVFKIILLFLTMLLILNIVAIQSAHASTQTNTVSLFKGLHVFVETVTSFVGSHENAEELNETNGFNNTIDRVPLFAQTDYPNVPYGKYGTVASHGCGIVCLSMVTTYLTDEFQSPADLATKYGKYNTPKGSYWSLFESVDQDFGIDMIKQTTSWEKVMDALRNGQVVIALQDKYGLFTDGGHYIVLTGLTEDGKIMVNDPNRKNWYKNQTMIEGFKNGFTEEQITMGGSPYWIYEKKCVVE